MDVRATQCSKITDSERMTFDREKFEQEMEELKRIPVLMNEEWELSKAMDEQEQD